MKYYTLLWDSMYVLSIIGAFCAGVYRHEILDWFLMQLVRFKIADYSDGMPDINDLETGEK